MNYAELLKPFLKALAAAISAFLAGLAAEWLGADIDSVSLATIITSLLVGIVTWAVPNKPKAETSAE